MSMYKVQKYIEHISKVLGQSKDGENKKVKVADYVVNRIDDDKELIKHSKEIGLRVPKKY